MSGAVVDLEEYRARLLLAERGPLRLAGVELSVDGDRVVLTLPSGHREEIRGSVVMGERMKALGEWAHDVETGAAEEELFT